jgi:SAM-dependent methyltransferase
MSLPTDYFDRMYDSDADPWGFGSRWYEERKYALTVAALPDPAYRSGIEVGCSIGVLTTALAARCRRLVAMDPSATALEAAGSRIPGNVELRRGSVPGDWPAGRYDLIMLSEVGYYLDRPDLARLLDLVQRDLQPGGTLLACHWRHPVADYPLTGDDVHAALADRWPGTSRVSRIEEEDFLLDVLAPGAARSVARRTGLFA